MVRLLRHGVSHTHSQRWRAAVHRPRSPAHLPQAVAPARQRHLSVPRAGLRPGLSRRDAGNWRTLRRCNQLVHQYRLHRHGHHRARAAKCLQLHRPAARGLARIGLQQHLSVALRPSGLQWRGANLRRPLPAGLRCRQAHVGRQPQLPGNRRQARRVRLQTLRPHPDRLDACRRGRRRGHLHRLDSAGHGLSLPILRPTGALRTVGSHGRTGVRRHLAHQNPQHPLCPAAQKPGQRGTALLHRHGQRHRRQLYAPHVGDGQTHVPGLRPFARCGPQPA